MNKILESFLWTYPSINQVMRCLETYGYSNYQFCRTFNINYNSLRSYLSNVDIRYSTYAKIINAVRQLDEECQFDWRYPTLLDISQYFGDKYIQYNSPEGKLANLTKRQAEDIHRRSNLYLSTYGNAITYRNLLEEKRAKEFNMLEF